MLVLYHNTMKGTRNAAKLLKLLQRTKNDFYAYALTVAGLPTVGIGSLTYNFKRKY